MMNEILDGKSGDKILLLGNEAIARGALEAGVGMVCCYPGTPSSEVVDTLYRLRAEIEEEGGKPAFDVEYSINEKVAMEVACGAALGGARSLVAMKHVGLNVAADPMFTAAYIGMPGGLVILSADDPGCHSSQNEQDNRVYARFASLPCLEPASPEEARQMVRAAFEIGRKLEQPVMLRTTTRVSHSRGPVTLGELPKTSELVKFHKNPGHFVPVPAVARRRHHALAEAMRKAEEISEDSPFNTCHEAARPFEDARRGIIASGIARAYMRDALKMLGLEDRISILELGMTWPAPGYLLYEFLKYNRFVLVLEEGAPLLEREAKIATRREILVSTVEGKDEQLTEFGEYSTSLVAARIARWLGIKFDAPLAVGPDADLPGRPPGLCPGCSHRAVYYAAKKVFGDEVIYSSDIGCYTLGMMPPLNAADFLVCMGSSVSAGSGFSRVSGAPVVAFIGDSTFFHSGMTGLANAVFNRHNLLVVVLDNGTTAMTGHQPNPGMVQESLGERSAHLDIETIVRALGVEHCAKVKSNNLRAMMETMEAMRDKPGVRVIIAHEPCMLYARHSLKKRNRVVAKLARSSPEAEQCFQELACPAFMRENGELKVDENMCTGCMICRQIAPEAFVPHKKSQQ